MSARRKAEDSEDDRWFAEPVPSPGGDRLALAARTIDRNAWLLEDF